MLGQLSNDRLDAWLWPFGGVKGVAPEFCEVETWLGDILDTARNWHLGLDRTLPLLPGNNHLLWK